MLLEIVLYVEQRKAGRVLVGDGKIVKVVENGMERAPKLKSFNAAVKHIMDETDLEPINPPVQIGPKSCFTTYKYTYRKLGIYVQAQYGKWACAHPVENYWMVKRAGTDMETRFESKTAAMADVDVWVGYDYLSDLRRWTVDKNHKTRRELGGQ